MWLRLKKQCVGAAGCAGSQRRGNTLLVFSLLAEAKEGEITRSAAVCAVWTGGLRRASASRGYRRQVRAAGSASRRPWGSIHLGSLDVLRQPARWQPAQPVDRECRTPVHFPGGQNQNVFEAVMKAQSDELACFLFSQSPAFLYFCVCSLPSFFFSLFFCLPLFSTKEGRHTYSALSHKTKGNLG